MNEIITDKNNSLVQVEFNNKLFDAFAESIRVSPESLKTYRKSINLFLGWLRENRITQPTEKDIIAYQKELTDKEFSPSTIQIYTVSIRKLFNWLSKEKLYENIAQNIKGASITKGFKKDYLTEEQVKKVLSGINQNTLKGCRDYAIMCLMVTTGLRTIEVSRANIQDIKTVGNDTLVLYVEGKGEREKTEYVKLAKPAFDAIKKYLAMRYDNAEYEAAAPLFASTSNNSKGCRMTTKSISAMVKESFVYVGLDSKRLTAHSLRHTAATLSLIKGKELGIIDILEQTRQLLRHAKLETTLIYAHHIDREKNMCEERIAEAIFS